MTQNRSEGAKGMGLRMDQTVGLDRDAVSSGNDDLAGVIGVRRAVRGFALLALLVGFFLFVPLLQGFSLSAGQGLNAGDAEAVANAIAAEEAQRLAARR
jgi:hypothetical protein